MPLSGIAAVINTRYCNTPAGMFHVKHFQPAKHSRKRIQGMDQARQSRKQDPGTGSKYRIQAEYLRKLSENSPETKQKIFQVFLQAFLKKILRKDLLNI